MNRKKYHSKHNELRCSPILKHETQTICDYTQSIHSLRINIYATQWTIPFELHPLRNSLFMKSMIFAGWQLHNHSLRLILFIKLCQTNHTFSVLRIQVLQCHFPKQSLIVSPNTAHFTLCLCLSIDLVKLSWIWSIVIRQICKYDFVLMRTAGKPAFGQCHLFRSILKCTFNLCRLWNPVRDPLRKWRRQCMSDVDWTHLSTATKQWTRWSLRDFLCKHHVLLHNESISLPPTQPTNMIHALSNKKKVGRHGQYWLTTMYGIQCHDQEWSWWWKMKMFLMLV